MELSGSVVHEYVVCPRAAWFTYRSIRLENDLVEMGRMIHEKSYKRDIKNLFGERISIDFSRSEDGEVRIYEIKKSSKMLNAARYQLLFYLKWLKEHGVEAVGRIVVPEERYSEDVILSEEAEEKIEKLLGEIENVIMEEKPPARKWRKACEKCSYHDLCWV